MKAAELTDLAIEWMKSAYPASVIVTELSVDDWGGARIDVGAITEKEIVGIEIKGDGDSPSRLELQGLIYGKVARRMWLLAAPGGTLAERCEKRRPTGWGRLEVFDGSVRPRNVARKIGPLEKTTHGTRHRWVPDLDTYKPDHAMQYLRQCPWAMCGTLWRDELYDIARLHGVQIRGRASVGQLTDAIIAQMPVPKLHDAMIDQLQNRVWRKPVIDCRAVRPGKQQDSFL